MAAKGLGYVILTLSFEQEDRNWVGTCMELGTSTFARTLKQTQAELRELVVEHLDLLEEAGERKKFFQKWGIEMHPTKAAPKQFTIRGSGDHWKRLFGPTVDPKGPFLRPGVFPVRRIPGRRQEPVGA